MSKNAAIDIFLRVRPSKKPFSGLSLKQEDNKVEYHIPKDEQKGLVNNQQEQHNFLFNKLLGMEAKQEDVFNAVAKDVVDSALDGYNGTVFAYGQTGSGKTYTMTGPPERYNERGIIPRTLQYIFQETSKKQDVFYNICVSYIEIYDNQAYDLLDENHATTNKLSDLKKVQAREDVNGVLFLEDLSVHKIETEQQALNLLWIGDMNRVISETPKNDASTRSHCIFMIQIEGQQAHSDGKKFQSKVCLVDLSGSERVGKTGVDGLLLKEARFINLSLHFLEHVIVCLNRKAKGENIHVPYRNSLMTMMLKDSLGGNSKTRMIATVSAEGGDIDESMSTCRFAQRVAMINNKLLKNEVVDPYLIIQKLKKENEELRYEIALLKGGDGKTALDQTDIEECKRIIDNYITSNDPSSRIVLKDMLMIHECFYMFKHKFNDLHKKYEKMSSVNSTKKILNEGLDMNENKAVANENSLALNEEVKRLKLLIQQRDNEIAILLNLINKPKGPGEESVLLPLTNPNTSFVIMNGAHDNQMYKPVVFPKIDEGENAYKNGESTPQRSKYPEPTKPLDIVQRRLREEDSSVRQETSTQKDSILSKATVPQKNQYDSLLLAPLNLTNEQLKDRAVCFELFRKSYRKSQALEENKEILKQKFAQAKQLGNLVNSSRNEINRLKNEIEDLRKERALQGLLNNQNEVIQHPDDEKLANEIERYKKIYKDNYATLKDLKSEIESIQSLLERSHQKLQKDFDNWLEVMLNQNAILANVPIEKTLKESQRSNLNNNTLNLSMTSTASKTKGANLDSEVQKTLAAFYKARDEIYKQP